MDLQVDFYPFEFFQEKVRFPALNAQSLLAFLCNRVVFLGSLKGKVPEIYQIM